MSSENSEFIITGGGIGGLATALGLARKGFSSIVLEKASRFGEIGAGIQLGPNAFHCFDFLGVGEAARRTAVYIDQLTLMDAVNGRGISHIPLDEGFRTRYGNPYAVVHRGDLHNVLLQACKKSDLITLRVKADVSGYRRQKDRVEVLLDNEEPVIGAALIGADGLWSNIRKQVAGDDPPRVSGHTTYRSVIPYARMPEEIRWNAAALWAGPRCHIVHYPLSGWKYFNLVATCHNEAPEPVAGKSVSREEVIKGFEHIHPLPRSIVDIATDWKQWVLCDRDPVTTWTDGNVALLGDAAHPMMQYMAQGACMAMEDAVCLSRQMAFHHGDPLPAFADYESLRITRTARVVLASRAMGDHVYHPDGAHAMVRNKILGSWSAEEYYHRLDWLYGDGHGVWV